MTLHVRLSCLIPGGEIDSRNPDSRAADLDQLANSISHLGLILPLSVIAEGDRYRVIDGNRRLAALRKVYEGQEEECHVPVLVQNVDLPTAREMSLAANIERVPLHELDQYEAFAAIAAEGKSVEDIAVTFGIRPRQVQQRMALGNLLPEIKEDWRRERGSVTLIQALANLEPEEQRRLWDTGERGWRLQQLIEQTRKGLTAQSPVTRFVGRQAYAEAGGTFVRDLFKDETQEEWADGALALQLAEAKVAGRTEELKAEGWSFVERSKTDWLDWSLYSGNEETPAEADLSHLSRKERKEWKEITARYAELKALEQPDEEQLEEAESIEDRLRELEERVDFSWSKAQKAELGVVITANYEVHVGIRKKKRAADEPEAEVREPKEVEEPDHSAGVDDDLNVVRTNTVQAVLANEPKLAKRVLVTHLLNKIAMCYDTSLSIQLFRFIGGGKPFDYGHEDVDHFLKRMKWDEHKMSFGERVAALETLDDQELDQLLAWLVAQSVTTQYEGGNLAMLCKDSRNYDPLWHWQPTVENFFGRLNKKQLQKLADEEGLDLNIAPMKKAAAAEAVRAKLPETWLPKKLRPV